MGWLSKQSSHLQTITKLEKSYLKTTDKESDNRGMKKIASHNARTLVRDLLHARRTFR